MYQGQADVVLLGNVWGCSGGWSGDLGRAGRLEVQLLENRRINTSATGPCVNEAACRKDSWRWLSRSGESVGSWDAHADRNVQQRTADR